MGPNEDMASSDLGESVLEVATVAVVPGVVGHHRLDVVDVGGTKRCSCSEKKACTGRTRFVGQDLRMGKTRVVVDHRVHVVEAEPPHGHRAGPSAMSPPSAAEGDLAKLFHVDVDQLTWALALIAKARRSAGSDHFARHGVAFREPGHA